MEIQSESWKRQQMIIPPNRLKSTPNHVLNHPHRIHTQIGSKSQSAKSTQSITETPSFPFFPFLQSTKCDKIRIQPFIHTIQINHPNTATHTSTIPHNNSKLNLLSIRPTITQTQATPLLSPFLSLPNHSHPQFPTHSIHTPQSHTLPPTISILSPFTSSD